MDKKLKTLASWLLAPPAIGIYVTLIISWFCFTYYIKRDLGVKDVGWINLVTRAHQNSIDFRLQSRGPRPGSPQVALLTIDERAVTTVGRWPWPREVTAKAVENAFKYGAKILAFDMTFSEPSANAGQEIYDKLKQTQSLAPEVETVMKSEIHAHDGDAALAEVYGKYADRIVAGSFYSADDPDQQEVSYSDFCYDVIFKRSIQGKLWDHEEVLITPEDQFQQPIPGKLMSLFSQAIQSAEDAAKEEVKKTFGEHPSKKDQVVADAIIHDKLKEHCTALLDDPDMVKAVGEYWTANIRPTENPKELKFDTYEQWLANLKSQSLPNSILAVDGWVLDIPQIAEKTKHTGYFNAFQDSDGTIRATRLIVRSGKSYFPSLALKAYLVAKNQNAALKINVNPSSGKREISEFGLTDNDTGNVISKLVTDGQANMMINYAGPEKMFAHMSMADLLSDGDEAEIEQRALNPADGHWEVLTKKVKKSEWIKDKIFVVGATAIGIYDLRVTPFQENYPGAETHANVISNLITRNFMKPWDEERAKMPLMMLIIGLVLSLTLAQLGAVGGLSLTGVFLGSFLLLDKYYLFDKGVVVTIVWPILMIGGVFVTMTFYRYFTEERGKKELRQTFAKYVSPAIVEEILSDPKNIELGGRKQELTVFFSDVRGFTTISEKLDPRALSDLLNSYLTPMTELVFKNRGTLDKYMGDAIMAFFGAPIHYNDHAKYACRCALQSLTKLFELQKEYEKKGLPAIDIGIGLNSGEVSVGNMGSATVRSYTVMGDAVNLASRLEGINKTYGTRIIMSEFTHNQVKDDFTSREVDWVRVKGKALPVKIFELISEAKAPEKTIEVLKWFQEGYLKYHEKSWNAAIESFTRALNLQPDDEVSKVYLTRCQEYLVEPPPENWDGVFVMKTK